MTYLVEFYLPTQAHGRLETWIARAVRAAGELRATGVPVRCLGSVLLAEDETCFLRFEAASAAVVEEAVRRAEIEFERIVEAQEAPALRSRKKGNG